MIGPLTWLCFKNTRARTHYKKFTKINLTKKHTKKKKERKVADLHGLNENRRGKVGVGETRLIETRRGWRRRDETDMDETRLT